MMQFILVALMAILIALRLPSVMNRLEMKGREKVIFVIMAFALLGLAWLAVEGFGVIYSLFLRM